MDGDHGATAVRSNTLRAQLAQACNILAMEGHTDISLGHASVREPGAQEYWMKASGFGLEEVTEDDIVLLDFDGNKRWGDRRPHNETPIHAEIYRVRPDVCAVVHTHPPYATAMAATAEPLRPVSHDGVLFPTLPRFVQTTDLIITREQGAAVAKALGPHNAVLLKNHGVVTAAATLEEASLFAIFLERAAMMQSLAASFGRFEWTNPEEAAEKRRRIFSPALVQNFWAYYRRKLERRQRQA